jgi:aryl-alcohol dehydrogenase-like predicted oxidoreductase
MSTQAPLRPLGQTALQVGPIAYGLWRFVGSDVAAGRARIEAALAAGMNLIDVAAVYGLDWGGQAFGESEDLLGRVLAETPGLRARMVLATKFGIIPGIPYDSGAEAVIASCEASLKRLRTDVIDLFQVHRPDVLTHPEELAHALARLRKDGKIREIGVSNYTVPQTRALLRYLDRPLATLQPEFSAIAVEPAFDGVLDLAMEARMTPLAWSPLGGGRLADGVDAADPATRRVATRLDELARAHGTTRSAVALAFVMRHPSRPMPILGTQNPARIAAATDALKINLTRAEWYSLVVAARGVPMP